MTGDTEVSADDLDEVRVALGRPDGGHVADEPKQEARDPEAQTDAERGGERAVEDRDGAWRAAHQDRFGQRAMHGRRRSLGSLRPSDHHSAAEREERQKEARRGKRDRQAEHDLDQPAETARGIAKCER